MTDRIDTQANGRVHGSVFGEEWLEVRALLFARPANEPRLDESRLRPPCSVLPFRRKPRARQRPPQDRDELARQIFARAAHSASMRKASHKATMELAKICAKWPLLDG